MVLPSGWSVALFHSSSVHLPLHSHISYPLHLVIRLSAFHQTHPCTTRDPSLLRMRCFSLWFSKCDNQQPSCGESRELAKYSACAEEWGRGNVRERKTKCSTPAADMYQAQHNKPQQHVEPSDQPTEESFIWTHARAHGVYHLVRAAFALVIGISTSACYWIADIQRWYLRLQATSCLKLGASAILHPNCQQVPNPLPSSSKGHRFLSQGV